MQGPDLYRRQANGEIREAILDLVVEWPGAGRRHLIDVTVRCPHAVRYPSSASKAGVAAAAGYKDKRDHYGPTVSPFAVESFGRFGEGARICLADFAADASRYGKARIGHVVRLDVKKLRLKLEATLLMQQADRALMALGTNSLAALGWDNSS